MKNKKQPLWVIADASGSMAEIGKMIISLNIISFLRDKLVLNGNSVFYKELNIIFLNDEAKLVKCGADDRISFGGPKGSLNVNALSELMKPMLDEIQNSEDAEEVRMLLLTDGHFSSSQKEAFKRWKNSSPAVVIRGIAVGPDANRTAIKDLTEEGKVFLSENISHALECWPSRGSVKGPLPVSLLTIEEEPEPEPEMATSPVEEEDEW